MPFVFLVFKPLIPKHLNRLKILSSTSQYLVQALLWYPVLDLSSQRTVQFPNLPQFSSLEPTNCHIVGPSSWQQSCRGRKETRAGTKADCAGNSYHTVDGKIAALLCHAFGWPRMKAASGVHGAGWEEVAWAEPPLISTSLIARTVTKKGLMTINWMSVYSLHMRSTIVSFYIQFTWRKTMSKHQ